MTSPTFDGDLHDIIKGGLPDERALPAAGETGPQERLRRSKWRFLEAHALAQPVAMQLRPVREGGRIVDFEWERITQGAARLLHGGAVEFLGRRLLANASCPFDARQAFEPYMEAAQRGMPTTLELAHGKGAGKQWVRHIAARQGAGGLLVTLVNLTAAQQAEALWAEFLAQERALLDTAGLPPPPARRVARSAANRATAARPVGRAASGSKTEARPLAAVR